MFDAEEFIAALSARELSELFALLSDRYGEIIEDWRTGFNEFNDDNDDE
jgi:hypothetical protein